jgi:hypothetical protein
MSQNRYVKVAEITVAVLLFTLVAESVFVCVAFATDVIESW